MLAKLLYRPQQFLQGLFASYSGADDEYVKAFLSPELKKLFDRLPNFEKKHSVKVSRLMLAGEITGFDKKELARLGLLHDIGKVARPNSLLLKVWLTVLRKILPPVYNLLSEWGSRGGFFYPVYVNRYHGKIGRELLSAFALPDWFLLAVERHDPYNDYNDEKKAAASPLLVLLRQADYGAYLG